MASIIKGLNGFAFRRIFANSQRRFTSPPPSTAEDPSCDPNSPLELQFGDISVAHHRIQSGIVRTDCRRSRRLSNLFGLDLYLKMEVNQDTGSFKERGARFALMRLSEEERKNGVFAASAGNHALALCLHGKDLGVEVNVVMPSHAPIMKIDKCQELGANILVQGKDIAESREIALKMAKDKGSKYINGYDYYDILAGAGTIGIEVLEQVPDVDAILVPVGGCGLIAGVATAVKTLSPRTKIIGVGSETCPSLIRSLEAGHPTYTPAHPTLADGLAVPNVGVNAFRSLQGKVDEVISVAENDIAVAILRLLEYEKVVCEGAGAIGIGALLSGKLDALKGKKVVSVLTGGNIDSTALGRCIERGLAHDNRVVRFNVIVSDSPGGVAELSQIVADAGASVKDIYMERAFLRNDLASVRVKMVAETRGAKHVDQLKEALVKRYSNERCNFRVFRNGSDASNKSD